MTGDPDRVEWSAVDGESDRAAEYLDAVTGLDAIEAYKRRSHRLLRPAPGDRLVDVGCGVGDDVLALADHVRPGGAVVGVDRSGSLLADARARGADAPAASYCVGDVRDLPFEDDAVDGCRADRVLQHVPDPRTALAEMCRITCAGGRFASSEPNWTTFSIHVPDADAAVSGRVTDARWANARHPAIGGRLYALARDAGLADLEVDPITTAIPAFETADQVASVEERLERMRAAGALSEARAREWLEGVRRADARDRFFASITGFTVAGTLPA